MVKHGWRKWPAIIADADHVDIKVRWCRFTL